MVTVMLLTTLLTVRAQHRDEVVAILGDSNTQIGGDDCSAPTAWTYEWQRCYQPGSIRSYARSGATWSNTRRTRRNVEENIRVLGDDNTIYNQTERLRDAISTGEQAVPTLIIIMAGTNDAWFSRRRPGAFDKSAAEAMSGHSDSVLVALPPSQVLSLAESVRYNILRLRRMAPDAKIILLGPLQSVQAPDNMIITTGSIIESVGTRMGIPAIRLDRDFELSSASESRRKHLTTDGTHTSVEGATRLARFLCSRIESLYPSTSSN